MVVCRSWKPAGHRDPLQNNNFMTEEQAEKIFAQYELVREMQPRSPLEVYDRWAPVDLNILGIYNAVPHIRYEAHGALGIVRSVRQTANGIIYHNLSPDFRDKKGGDGYSRFFVQLTNGKKTNVFFHRAVLSAFHTNPCPGVWNAISHHDNSTRNNSAMNLFYISSKLNTQIYAAGRVF